MKLSCILPTFNRLDLVIKCIDSLKKQDFKDFELLVIDDGSDEKTKAILSKIKGIKFFSSNHVGRSKARNFGLQKATGKFIFFAENDAIYSKNFLKDCLAHFDNSKVGGVIGKLEALNTESIWVKCRASELNSRFESKKGYKPFSAWMYPTKLLKSLNGFDSSLDIGEDSDLANRVKEKGFILEYEPKAVWKHFEPDTLLKVWKRFWFRGIEMPKYYKKNGLSKVVFLDLVAFLSLPAFFINPFLLLIFVFYSLIQVLIRLDYFNFIEKKYWLHLLFWLFSTMVVSKFARLLGFPKLFFKGFSK